MTFAMHAICALHEWPCLIVAADPVAAVGVSDTSLCIGNACVYIYSIGQAVTLVGGSDTYRHVHGQARSAHVFDLSMSSRTTRYQIGDWSCRNVS
jgi:hypothetical protein